MNKLYVIRFYYPNGYLLTTWTLWDAAALKEKIAHYSDEWKFTLAEDNDTHQIWDAR